tara:strand:- start:13505 stop:14365 length:861 start_codon:yes stop_codon:yes gene_type:complete
MSIQSRLTDFLNKYTVELHSPKSSTVEYREWIAADYEDTFNENYKKYPQFLEYYKKRPIKYYINKQNFRSKTDFEPNKDKKLNIVIGCSHTFGIGLHWEHTWPVILNKQLNTDFINLGIPGGCMEASYITLKRFIDMYDVQNVFHLQPVYARYLVFNNSKLVSFISIQENIFKLLRFFFTENYIKSLFHDPDYMVYSHIKHLENIKYICQERNIPYFYSSSLPKKIPPGHHSLSTLPKDELAEQKESWKHDILARDLSHPSFHANKEVAEKFYTYFKNYPKGFSKL